MKVASQFRILLLTPMLVLSLASAVMLTVLYLQMEQGIAQLLQERLADARHILERDMETLAETADVITRTGSVRDAIVTSDFDEMLNLAQSYSGVEKLRVYFLDPSGMVLLRSFDENKFGDQFETSGRTTGIHAALQDDSISLRATRQLLENETERVGYVVTERLIDREYLNQLSAAIRAEIGIGYGDQMLRSQNDASLHMTEEGAISLSIADDAQIQLLIKLDQSEKYRTMHAIFAFFSLLALLLAATLIYFGNRFLKKTFISPMAELVKISGTSGGTTNVNPKLLPLNEIKSVTRRVRGFKNELQSKTEELSRSIAELEIQKQQLEDDQTLLKAICHDIASPLMVLTASIEIAKQVLAEGKSGHDHSKFDGRVFDIAVIERSTMIITEILNHVRAMIALQMDGGNFELEPVDFREVSGRIRTLFDTRIANKNIQVIYEIDETNCVFAAETTSFFNHVFSNIFSNALKFSAPGSRITVRCFGSGDRIAIEVQDKGCGIPEKRINEMLAGRSAKSTRGTSGETGNGLGLQVARSYVKMYNATLEIDSKVPTGENDPDRGTTIRILLNPANASYFGSVV